MPRQETAIFYPTTVDEWRAWLAENHRTHDAVWLVFHKKKSGIPSLTWSESVDMALCFGWIDSKKIKVDDTTSHQFFSKRKARSTWSKINKDKVQQLIDSGLMTEAGYQSIAIAQQNGSWTILDEVDAMIIPEDLEAMFASHPGSKDYYLSLSNSKKKLILYWIIFAKRPETRLKRITEVVTLASQGRRPGHMV